MLAYMACVVEEVKMRKKLIDLVIF